MRIAPLSESRTARQLPALDRPVHGGDVDAEFLGDLFRRQELPLVRICAHKRTLSAGDVE
jgi:hypothetical protein